MFIINEIDKIQEGFFGDKEWKNYIHHLEKLLDQPMLQDERDMLKASIKAANIYLANPNRRRLSGGKV